MSSAQPLTYAELFAGAGGLSRGLEAAGFHCLAHAEIEPHARAVLRYRWPDTRLDGDVTQVDGREYAGCTLLSGGSPCQDLSIAGKRAGLTGARSSLFHEQCRIWNESGAPYFLWENVYGALSSNAGKDFATVLSSLVGATVDVPVVGRGKSARAKWQRAGVASGPTGVAAWRVLDLQYFGPPQRRVRVFVLAARAGGVDPAEVLALAEGVCWHSSPRQQAREGVTGRVAGGVGAGGVMAWDNKLNASTEAHGPLMARGKSGGDRNGVLAFHHTQDPIHGDVSPSIGRKTDGMGVLAFSENQRGEVLLGEVARQITTGGGKPGQGYPAVIHHSGKHEKVSALEILSIVMSPITSGAHSTAPGSNGQDAERIQTALGASGICRPRRLTPLECERLMSWPDEWTRYGTKEDGTVYELSDTARYRLCGNGVGSVCVEWIGARLAAAIRKQSGHPNEVAA